MKWYRIGTKRGLSSTVTAAMLLSAVTVMGIFVVGWSQSNLTQHQVALENTFSDKMNKLSEQVVYENVWLGTTPSNFVNVTLVNVGTVGLNVTQIEFDDGSINNVFTITDGGIVSDQVYSLEKTFLWTSNPINIFTTTARGNIYTTQVSPP